MNNEDFAALTDEHAEGELCEDSTEMLLKKYERRREQKTDDIFAVQTLICLLLAAGFFVLNYFKPDLCGELFERLSSLISDEKELFPNPIDYLPKK